jgi:modification methylase
MKRKKSTESPESTKSQKKKKKDKIPVVKIHNYDARKLDEIIEKESIDLILTSPPYPMIKMWDEVFRDLDDKIPEVKTWNENNIHKIFKNMHEQLDIIWKKLFVVLKEGGIAIINIGDAMRTFNKIFQVFPNSSMVISGMLNAGFIMLPNIYWKKPNNRPNSFLGSGFYPVNAYVSVDCEHILIFRKGKLRKFPKKDKNRENSKFTKEERNKWFSQLWNDVNGIKQREIGKRRTAEFPEEIPRRLIKMYSVIGDVVLDPFIGTGTTAKVAIELGRDCVGIEINKDFVIESKSKLMI